MSPTPRGLAGLGLEVLFGRSPGAWEGDGINSQSSGGGRGSPSAVRPEAAVQPSGFSPRKMSPAEALPSFGD